MRTRQKRRILPDTMIQEIGRSVKCQKLNKFINRTPILSVNKPNPLRGDQFPGDPRWLSGQAGTFFPLTVLSRRNLTLRQTRPTPRDCQGIAPRRGAALKCGRNLRFPHKRPLPLYTHDDLQRAAPRMSRRFGKNCLTKSDKFTVRSLIHSFSFTT